MNSLPRVLHRLEQGEFERPRNGRNNDKAHPPIHPTNFAGNLMADEKRVYEFITRRFLACCSKNAEGMKTELEVECGGEEFFASGNLLLGVCCLPLVEQLTRIDCHCAQLPRDLSVRQVV